jgi:hypothetical protein
VIPLVGWALAGLLGWGVLSTGVAIALGRAARLATHLERRPTRGVVPDHVPTEWLKQ